MSNPAAKARLLGQVSARTAEAAKIAAEHERVLGDRDADALRAKGAGATYGELQSASGLSRIGVYKMLERANGGPLTKAGGEPAEA